MLFGAGMRHADMRHADMHEAPEGLDVGPRTSKVRTGTSGEEAQDAQHVYIRMYLDGPGGKKGLAGRQLRGLHTDPVGSAEVIVRPTHAHEGRGVLPPHRRLIW